MYELKQRLREVFESKAALMKTDKLVHQKAARNWIFSEFFL